MSDLLEAILERDKESRSVACPLWYVSDEQRSRSPKAPQPFGEPRFWAIAALQFVGDVPHRLLAAPCTDLKDEGSKCPTYSLAGP